MMPLKAASRLSTRNMSSKYSNGPLFQSRKLLHQRNDQEKQGRWKQDVLGFRKAQKKR
jgi:hypothetical protein